MTTSEKTRGSAAASQAPTQATQEPTEREQRARMYAKLSKVMGKMHRLEKRGFNSHFGYAFATNEDVVDAVRVAMAEEGLAMFTELGEIIDSSVPSRNGDRAKVRVDFIFTICDGETGYFEERHWVSEALDDQDKGLNKAATAAQKYFLLKTFMIGTGDEPDPDREGDAEKEDKKKGKGSKASQPVAPPAGQPASQGNGQRAPAPAPNFTLTIGKAEAKDPPTWPKDGKDTTAYFAAIVPFYKVETKAAAWLLKHYDGNAVSAAQALARGERPGLAE